MSENNDKWAPNRIWLQRGVGEGGSHTWCEDSQAPDCEEIEYVRAAPAPSASPAALTDEREDLADLVGKAMTRAWSLGQTYWQQADSEYASQNRKSEATQAKFQALIDETRTAILAANTENDNG